MRTPASGARGGLPVKNAMPSFTCAAAQCEPVRNLHFRRGNAGDFFQHGERLLHRPIAVLVAQNVTLAKPAFFRGKNVPDGHVAHMNPVQSGVQIRRQSRFKKSTMIWPVGVGFTSPGPTGAEGFTMTIGKPLSRDNFDATASACHFDRL